MPSFSPFKLKGERMPSLPTKRIATLAIGLSLLYHLILGAVLQSASRSRNSVPKNRKPGSYVVKVKPKEEPKPLPQPKLPEVPKPKVKPKPLEPVSNTKKAPPPNKAPVTPIQGLTKESLAQDGKGNFTAPIGNTLMIEDEGRRVTEVAPLTEDLSSDPKLLPESVLIPTYTDAALDAGFEGRVTIEVYVDAAGHVIQAEPQKKIGYGMDEKILKSALSARFIPRKNRLGQPEEGWSKITFNLQVP